MKKKEVNRCAWVGSDLRMIKYHDEEWGVPVHNERELFEFLVLEGAQAGLSWTTILNRREYYQKAFFDFDVKRVAQMTETDIESLVTESNIIRNRLKVKSAITNAQMFLNIQKDFGSFDNYIWKFVENKTIQNKFTKLSEIPASTTLSEKISKELKKRGFTFIGPKICYAYMQTIGIVNDHLISCFRYNEIVELSKY